MRRIPNPKSEIPNNTQPPGPNGGAGRTVLVVASVLAILIGAGLRGAPAAPEDGFVLAGATVHTVAGETIEKGQVWIKGGRIAGVGASVDAAGATVIDLAGKHLYPGLIAATTSLGLSEIDAVRATQDTREVGAYAPDVQAWIAVNPDSELIPVARANGVTHALTVPLGGVVSGQSGLIALAGWTWEQMTAQAPVALHVFWPGMDLDLTPQSQWQAKTEWKSPEKQAEERRTRLKELDDFFDEAAAYAKARAAAQGAAAAGIADDHVVPAWEAMLPYVAGTRPVMIHADEVRQIKAALAWAGKRKLRIILAGGRDAWRVAELVAKAQVPVIWEHTFERPVRDTESYDVHFKAAALLARAGVTVAFSPGPGSWPAAEVRNLPYHAAQSAAFGLPPDEALKGITLYPARILGVADRLGSIEAGKDATLFAADGDILDLRTHVTRMWIAGAEVSLESRHTRLYRRYRDRPAGK